MLAATGIAPGTSNAQAASGASTAVGPSRLISTNPFLPLFGFFSAEYEQRLKDNVAFAISGSHTEYDALYTHLDAKVRLYPNEKALEGFGLASSLGIAWVKRDDCDSRIDFDCAPTSQGGEQARRRFTTPTFAIELDYQWLLGRTKSTAITVGFGAKRYLGGNDRDYIGIERVLPTGRLSIGYGF
ncbi:MAG: hypothetical protein ABIW79_06150 [Gemmatimonas sp.]